MWGLNAGARFECTQSGNSARAAWQFASFCRSHETFKLDSSIAARKRLAEELHYTGNLKDSASMNVWLHKQVMIKLRKTEERFRTS
jgi:hypothetical protein